MDNSEYISAGITPGYVDKNGFPKSFKVVWVSSTVILLLIGAWMIYNKQSSSAYVGGSKYGIYTGRPRSINGYGVLLISTLMTLFGATIFWPRSKKKPKTAH